MVVLWGVASEAGEEAEDVVAVIGWDWRPFTTGLNLGAVESMIPLRVEAFWTDNWSVALVEGEWLWSGVAVADCDEDMVKFRRNLSKNGWRIDTSTAMGEDCLLGVVEVS